MRLHSFCLHGRMLAAGFAGLFWTSALVAGTERSLTDMTGNPVAVPLQATRVLSFSTCATDALLELGCAERIAGIDEYSRIVPGADSIPIIAKGSAFSKEALAASRADLAFVWWYQDDLAAVLSDLGIPVFRVTQPRAMDVPDWIRTMGDIIDKTNAATQAAAHLEHYLSVVSTAATGQIRVYLELYEPYRTVGVNNYIDDLIRLAGGINVSTGNNGGHVLSPEQLSLKNPDVILYVKGFGSADEIKRRPALANSPAVRNNRVYGIDRSRLIAGLHLPEAVDYLRERITLDTPD